VTIKKTISAVVFALCVVSAFFMPSFAFASSGEQEVLSVDAAWIEGEMLKINVTNVNTGKKQKLELHLEDYTNSSEYISIQAVDTEGNKSNVVQVKNPYYKPEETTQAEETTETAETTTKSDGAAETAIPNNGKSAFTPAGNGEVMDNADENDGKEFFTIKTKDKNVFYLIVDRQRGNENVYLLNSVSESDLMALAEKGGTGTVSAIPEQTAEQTEQTETAAEQEQSKSDTGGGMGTIFLIFIVVGVVGGVGYYFKIYKPKHSDNDTDNDEEINSYDEDGRDEDSYEKDFYDDDYNEFLSDDNYDENASEKENSEE